MLIKFAFKKSANIQLLRLSSLSQVPIARNITKRNRSSYRMALSDMVRGQQSQFHLGCHDKSEKFKATFAHPLRTFAFASALAFASDGLTSQRKKVGDTKTFATKELQFEPLPGSETKPLLFQLVSTKMFQQKCFDYCNVSS